MVKHEQDFFGGGSNFFKHTKETTNINEAMKTMNTDNGSECVNMKLNVGENTYSPKLRIFAWLGLWPLLPG